jgi:hypothetical protein
MKRKRNSQIDGNRDEREKRQELNGKWTTSSPNIEATVMQAPSLFHRNEKKTKTKNTNICRTDVPGRYAWYRYRLLSPATATALRYGCHAQCRIFLSNSVCSTFSDAGICADAATSVLPAVVEEASFIEASAAAEADLPAPTMPGEDAPPALPLTDERRRGGGFDASIISELCVCQSNIVKWSAYEPVTKRCPSALDAHSNLSKMQSFSYRSQRRGRKYSCTGTVNSGRASILTSHTWMGIGWDGDGAENSR